MNYIINFNFISFLLLYYFKYHLNDNYKKYQKFIFVKK